MSSSIKNTSTSQNKKIHSLSLSDLFGNNYLSVPSYSNSFKWFNIAKCEINTDGHIDENDGLIPDAIPFHAEEVAYLLAQSEAHQEQLEKLEVLFKEWISLRRSRSRKAKRPRLQLQKKEAVN